MKDDGITADELQTLRETTSSGHWNVACDAIKKAHGGRYPSDWFEKVLHSGLLNLVSKYWIIK